MLVPACWSRGWVPGLMRLCAETQGNGVKRTYVLPVWKVEGATTVLLGEAGRCKAWATAGARELHGWPKKMN